MKVKLLHFQIAAAALLAPAAMSLASVAKPAAPQSEAARAPVMISQPAQPAATCTIKVRVVYAGYAAPAPRSC